MEKLQFQRVCLFFVRVWRYVFSFFFFSFCSLIAFLWNLLGTGWYLEERAYGAWINELPLDLFCLLIFCFIEGEYVLLSLTTTRVQERNKLNKLYNVFSARKMFARTRIRLQFKQRFQLQARISFTSFHLQYFPF